MLPQILKLLFILSCALAPAFAFSCPLGPGEEQLTLSRVMRNFGRGLTPADRATQKGTMGGPGDVTDADLAAALNGLALVKSCVASVLADRLGVLLPRKAKDLKGEALERYVTLFHAMLGDFLNEVSRYEGMYKAFTTQPVDARDFAAAKVQMRAVTKAANRAHEDL